MNIKTRYWSNTKVLTLSFSQCTPAEAEAFLQVLGRALDYYAEVSSLDDPDVKLLRAIAKDLMDNLKAAGQS